MGYPHPEKISFSLRKAFIQSSLYISLLDRSYYKSNSEDMEYNGCLNEVMSDLEHVINKSRADKLLIFHPTRIIRAIIDYKIEHPNKLLESLVRESIDLGLSVYRKKRDCINKIGVLRNQILRSENEELLYLPLSQEKDSVTWNATNLTYSIQSAKSLNLQNKDILFIALGHGV